MPPSLYHSQVTQNVLTTLRRHLVGRGLERIYQTIRRLEILLRTILAALLKTKCNDRLVENKIYKEVGKECSTIAQMIVKDDRGKAIA